MFDCFKDSRERSHCHVKLIDIPAGTLTEWRDIVERVGVNPMTQQLQHQKSMPFMQEQLQKNKQLLTTIQYRTEEASHHISKSHLFVLTDPAGVILGVYGDKSVIRQLDQVKFSTGSSLAIEHAGINGVSAAMQLNKTVVVQGHEHDLELLNKWTCICAPIKLHNKVIAYLDLSFHASLDVTFAIPILKQVIHTVEKSLLDKMPTAKQTQIKSIFKYYHLSSREKEIAFLWLDGLSTSQIAKQANVSIETVRTHIKNIYMKTGINSKSEFIKSFLIY